MVVGLVIVDWKLEVEEYWLFSYDRIDLEVTDIGSDMVDARLLLALERGGERGGERADDSGWTL